MSVLSHYAEKRNFKETPEPGPEKSVVGSGPLTFVVQKHAAGRLHYDFRLEVGGVLKSWAVPKGVPAKKGERKLAVPTEDHPMAYGSFEGNIPKGQYGGGSVIVWDCGTFMPHGATTREEAETITAQGLQEGKLSFTLSGQKLRGEYTLVKTEKEDQWLMLRKDEGVATVDDPHSAISGRTIEEVRDGVAPKMANVESAPNRAIPEFLAPMVPEEHPKPFDNEDWTFELKLDGIRAIALRTGDRVKLLTRQGNDVTERFPNIVEELLKIPDTGFGLDGEIVVTDESGRPSFHALMERFGLKASKAPGKKAQYWAFDITHSEGKDLRRLPLRERRAVLEAMCPSNGVLRVLDTYADCGIVLYEQAIAMGFEGVVAKRLDSPYRDGQRSGDWRKIKRYHTEEFLVAGYTRGTGSREHTFGALILARQTEEGLTFCGSVGGGFSDVKLESVKELLNAQPQVANPFGKPIETKGEARFIEPKMIAEVRFMNWTPDGKLRMPQFVRLRPDLEGTTFSEPAAAPTPSVHIEGTDEVEEILAVLDEGKAEATIKVEGHSIKLTSLDKDLWPANEGDPAYTKRDLLAYYARVSRAMLPHLKDRPLAIVRHPGGITGPGFFQKHVDEGPDFIERVPIYSSHNKAVREWAMCNNLATLMWFGQMAALEIHPWYSRISQEPDAHELGLDFTTDEALDESVLSYPDFVVFDLDPSFPKLPVAEWWEPTVKVGRALRELLTNLGLRSYPKTSGKTGLHIYVPLRRDHTYAELRALAEGLGRHLMNDRSLQVTMEWKTAKRPDGIFFDHNQNVRGKTLAAPYSPRPVSGAPVSMPLRWEELEGIHPSDFHMNNVPSFLADRGDAWADLLADHQTLWFKPK